MKYSRDTLYGTPDVNHDVHFTTSTEFYRNVIKNNAKKIEAL